MKRDLGQVFIILVRLRVVKWLVQGYTAIQDKCSHAPFLGEIIQIVNIKMMIFLSSSNATLQK